MNAVTEQAEKPVKVKNLDSEIEATKVKLSRLLATQKEQKRKEQERNQKAIFELMREHKVDAVSADKWKLKMPEICKLLGV